MNTLLTHAGHNLKDGDFVDYDKFMTLIQVWRRPARGWPAAVALASVERCSLAGCYRQARRNSWSSML